MRANTVHILNVTTGTSRHPSGTLKYHTRESTDVNASGRWEFEGIVTTDIRDEYVGNAVGMGGQNPIRYKNVKDRRGDGAKPLRRSSQSGLQRLTFVFKPPQIIC